MNMYSVLQQDLDNLSELLAITRDKALQFLQGLSETRTSADKLPILQPSFLSEEGLGLQKAIETFYDTHKEHIVAAAGPRYWGYVTGGTTPAAIAGDWLATAFDQNSQRISTGGDVSAVIEQETIQQLLQLFHLPPVFKGGFVTGATMSNFTGLAVGRQWAGKQRNNDIAREGIQTPIKILAGHPHSSAIKCLSMLGLGSNNIELLKTVEGNREAIDMTDLEAKLELYSRLPSGSNSPAAGPIILISSAGTVNSADFDDLQQIAALRQRYNFYWHVDAAFGGFAACSPDHHHLLKGWEDADSITIDLHKWMNVPYDSAIYLVNNKHAALQVQTFQNGNAPYLGDPEKDFSYLNFGPENSRRLRALPALLSLIAYGRKGFQSIVDNSVTLARLFSHRLEAETPFRLIAPTRLNVVCFGLADHAHSGPGDHTQLDTILAHLNKSGKLFLTPTVYKGTYCLRAAFVNWRTNEEDIDIAIEELKKAVAGSYFT